MERFDVVHDDRHVRARVAAVRSAVERDPFTRARERSMSKAERLRAGFALSRFASRLRSARP
jgi:hypothetical protein